MFSLYMPPAEGKAAFFSMAAAVSSVSLEGTLKLR